MPGFPSQGLLQWWIDGADDTYGLDWGDQFTGKEGLYLRWYSEEDLSEEALDSPNSQPPYSDLDEMGPLDTTNPVLLDFEKRFYLPGYGEIYENSDLSELEGVLDQLEEAGLIETLDGLMMPGFQVGGRPVFVQGDPRYKEGRPDSLVLQLDSADGVFMWGDMGTAQLFGDPRKLGVDHSEFWWDWACG